MAIGPVQLIVLGFNHPDFHGEVIAELERLHENGMVRVIDSLAVYKDADGDLEVEHLSNLTQDEAIELGSKIGALIGLGFEGEDGMAAGAEAGADAAAAGATVFSDEQAWDVLTDIPNDSAAALILLEHHWAVPLQGRATYGSTHRPPGRPTPGLSRGRHRPARRPARGPCRWTDGSPAAARLHDRIRW